MEGVVAQCESGEWRVWQGGRQECDCGALVYTKAQLCHLQWSGENLLQHVKEEAAAAGKWCADSGAPSSNQPKSHLRMCACEIVILSVFLSLTLSLYVGINVAHLAILSRLLERLRVQLQPPYSSYDANIRYTRCHREKPGV